jgi:hypothetical protein
VAVGDEFFALMQAGLLACPVNVLSATVGQVDQFRLLHFSDSRALEIETRIVFRYDRIVSGCVAQFSSRTNTAGNDRVWINQALVTSLYLRLGQAGENRKLGAGRGIEYARMADAIADPFHSQNTTGE